MQFPNVERKTWIIMAGCAALIGGLIAASRSGSVQPVAASAPVPKVTPVTPASQSPANDSEDLKTLFEEAKRTMPGAQPGAAATAVSQDPQAQQLAYQRDLMAMYRQQSMGQGRQEQTMSDPMTIGPPLPKYEDPGKSPAAEQPDRDDDPPAAKPEASADFAVPTGSHNRWEGKRYAVFRGTAIDCQLVNDVSSDVPGPVNCVTSKEVKSQNGKHVLVPVNTFVSGRTETVSGISQHRLEMVFDYLRTPDGFEIVTKGSPAEDANGMNGVTGHTNNHLMRIWAQSLGFGLLGSASLIGNGSPLTGGGVDQLRYGFANGASEGGMQMLSRMSQIPPTITLKSGKTILVVMTDDHDFPSVDEHKMDGDL